MSDTRPRLRALRAALAQLPPETRALLAVAAVLPRAVKALADADRCILARTDKAQT